MGAKRTDPSWENVADIISDLETQNYVRTLLLDDCTEILKLTLRHLKDPDVIEDVMNMIQKIKESGYEHAKMR